VSKAAASLGEQVLLGKSKEVDAVRWLEHAKETHRTLLGFPCLVTRAIQQRTISWKLEVHVWTKSCTTKNVIEPAYMRNTLKVNISRMALGTMNVCQILFLPTLSYLVCVRMNTWYLDLYHIKKCIQVGSGFNW
jgi:hypothetical protein